MDSPTKAMGPEQSSQPAAPSLPLSSATSSSSSLVGTSILDDLRAKVLKSKKREDGEISDSGSHEVSTRQNTNLHLTKSQSGHVSKKKKKKKQKLGPGALISAMSEHIPSAALDDLPNPVFGPPSSAVVPPGILHRAPPPHMIPNGLLYLPQNRPFPLPPALSSQGYPRPPAFVPFRPPLFPPLLHNNMDALSLLGSHPIEQQQSVLIQNNHLWPLVKKQASSIMVSQKLSYEEVAAKFRVDPAIILAVTYDPASKTVSRDSSLDLITSLGRNGTSQPLPPSRGQPLKIPELEHFLGRKLGKSKPSSSSLTSSSKAKLVPDMVESLIIELSDSDDELNNESSRLTIGSQQTNKSLPLSKQTTGTPVSKKVQRLQEEIERMYAMIESKKKSSQLDTSTSSSTGFLVDENGSDALDNKEDSKSTRHGVSKSISSVSSSLSFLIDSNSDEPMEVADSHDIVSGMPLSVKHDTPETVLVGQDTNTNPGRVTAADFMESESAASQSVEANASIDNVAIDESPNKENQKLILIRETIKSLHSLLEVTEAGHDQMNQTVSLTQRRVLDRKKEVDSLTTELSDVEMKLEILSKRAEKLRIDKKSAYEALERDLKTLTEKQKEALSLKEKVHSLKVDYDLKVSQANELEARLSIKKQEQEAISMEESHTATTGKRSVPGPEEKDLQQPAIKKARHHPQQASFTTHNKESEKKIPNVQQNRILDKKDLIVPSRDACSITYLTCVFGCAVDSFMSPSLIWKPNPSKPKRSNPTQLPDSHSSVKSAKPIVPKGFIPYSSAISNFKSLRGEDNVNQPEDTIPNEKPFNPLIPFCFFESLGGTCSDMACEFQHFSSRQVDNTSTAANTRALSPHQSIINVPIRHKHPIYSKLLHLAASSLHEKQPQRYWDLPQEKVDFQAKLSSNLNDIDLWLAYVESVLPKGTPYYQWLGSEPEIREALDILSKALIVNVENASLWHLYLDLNLLSYHRKSEGQSKAPSPEEMAQFFSRATDLVSPMSPTLWWRRVRWELSANSVVSALDVLDHFLCECIGSIPCDPATEDVSTQREHICDILTYRLYLLFLLGKDNPKKNMRLNGLCAFVDALVSKQPLETILRAHVQDSTTVSSNAVNSEGVSLPTLISMPDILKLLTLSLHILVWKEFPPSIWQNYPYDHLTCDLPLKLKWPAKMTKAITKQCEKWISAVLSPWKDSVLKNTCLNAADEAFIQTILSAPMFKEPKNTFWKDTLARIERNKAIIGVSHYGEFEMPNADLRTAFDRLMGNMSSKHLVNVGMCAANIAAKHWWFNGAEHKGVLYLVNIVHSCFNGLERIKVPHFKKSVVKPSVEFALNLYRKLLDLDGFPPTLPKIIKKIPPKEERIKSGMLWLNYITLQAWYDTKYKLGHEETINTLELAIEHTRDISLKALLCRELLDAHIKGLGTYDPLLHTNNSITHLLEKIAPILLVSRDLALDRSLISISNQFAMDLVWSYCVSHLASGTVSVDFDLLYHSTKLCPPLDLILTLKDQNEVKEMQHLIVIALRNRPSDSNLWKLLLSDIQDSERYNQVEEAALTSAFF